MQANNGILCDEGQFIEHCIARWVTWASVRAHHDGQYLVMIEIAGMMGISDHGIVLQCPRDILRP